MLDKWFSKVRRGGSQRGVTLVELAAVSAVLVILAGVAIPVAHTMVKRQKELELRQALRTIREALDRFQFDTERYPGIRAQYLNATNEEGYPEELKLLYEGVEVGDAAGTKIKYLRRLPVDPMTGKREWGTRSSRDRPDALFSDGINIFDVHTLSEKKALDGTYYREW
jgi:general secretion pathway protein G